MRLYRWLDQLWATTGLPRQYKEILSKALDKENSGSSEPSLSRWLALPGLCAQAAGVDMDQAGLFTLAWGLMFRAAHLMDSVQDGDEPDDWWAEAGAGAALSASTGLYFTANLVLEEQLGSLPVSTASDIRRQFYSSLLAMTASQYLELASPAMNLEIYWQVAEGKSGEFFGLACWGGARLGQALPDQLNHYRNFGSALGVMIQVLDDLEDIKDLAAGEFIPSQVELGRCLPVVYAREVLQDDERAHFEQILAGWPTSPGGVGELISVLDGCRADLYILVELERYRQRALTTLEAADPLGEAGMELKRLVQEL